MMMVCIYHMVSERNPFTPSILAKTGFYEPLYKCTQKSTLFFTLGISF